VILVLLLFAALLAEAEAEEEAAGTSARGTTGIAETTPTGNRIRNMQRNRKNVVVMVVMLLECCLRGRVVLGNIQ
jgi:hypothetical protein